MLCYRGQHAWRRLALVIRSTDQLGRMHGGDGFAPTTQLRKGVTLFPRVYFTRASVQENNVNTLSADVPPAFAALPGPLAYFLPSVAAFLLGPRDDR